jgi:protein phosphatase
MPEYGVWAVADGMGGEQAGEVAAQMALDYLREQTARRCGEANAAQWFAEALSGANREIYTLAGQDADKRGMGTTVTALFIEDRQALIAHVGDSRAYLWRNQVLSQLTKDHSLVGELVRRGQITEDEADVHPQKNILTQAVGTMPEIEVDTSRWLVQAGDVLFLCTDGVSNMVSDAELSERLRSSELNEDFMQALKELIFQRGAKDNFTALLCVVE